MDRWRSSPNGRGGRGRDGGSVVTESDDNDEVGQLFDHLERQSAIEYDVFSPSPPLPSLVQPFSSTSSSSTTKVAMSTHAQTGINRVGSSVVANNANSQQSDASLMSTIPNKRQPSSSSSSAPADAAGSPLSIPTTTTSLPSSSSSSSTLMNPPRSPIQIEKKNVIHRNQNNASLHALSHPPSLSLPIPPPPA